VQHGRDPAHTKPVQQQHVESKLDILLWKVVSLGETNCAEKGLYRSYGEFLRCDPSQSPLAGIRHLTSDGLWWLSLHLGTLHWAT
jgi:hypothetical protein